MVKAYLNYEAAASFGVIATASVPAVPLPSTSHPVPYIVSAGVDAVLVWSVRKGEVVARYSNASTRKSATVSALAVSPDGSLIAAGYSDGSIRTWSVALEDSVEVLPEKEPVATFNGHRAHVSSIAFECYPRGEKSKNVPNRVVSGSADGDVIVWDLAGEAGVFRVPAHNDVVTSVIMLKQTERDIFISSSKDGLVRIYDIDTQHCLQTLAGHRAEVWAMCIDPTHTLLFTGSVDAEVRVFKFNDWTEENGNDKAETQDLMVPLGSVQRKTAAARVRAIHCDVSHGETFAVVAGNDKNAELFRVRSKDNANTHRQRRKKRAQTKAEKNRAARQEENGDEMEDDEFVFVDTLEAKDFLVPVRAFKMSSKIRGVHVLSDAYQLTSVKSKTLDVRFLLQTSDNALEVHKLIVSSQKKQKKRKRVAADDQEAEEEDKPSAKSEVGQLEKVAVLDRSGHRDDMRSISISPDDRLLLSTSKKSLKLWNIAVGSCIRSMEPAGYGLSTSFLGADGAFAAVGTKEGTLDVFDLGSGALVSSIPNAHDGAIWSMTLEAHIYDADFLITGGSDKKIKFWNISDLITGTTNAQSAVAPSRSMQMPDEILCVCVAKRDRPVLLASLMDSTVRAVFMDDFAPAMNFYGHKLPVMSMDVSSDGLILATGSADKTVKLWGIDFGDCRRSLRAHSDSVVSVGFQPKTHYFFSGSRDGSLKYWDGDKFEFIAEMPGQRGEVWAIGVSGDGEMVATASHDKMLRVWRRTDEPLFLAEEEDRRMDEMFESTLVDDDVREARKTRGKQIEFLGDGGTGEALRAGKVSLDTIKGGEKLLEALELYAEETNRVLTGDDDEGPNPYLLGLAPDAYLLRTLEQIRTADLDEVMHVLPLSEAVTLLGYVTDLLEPGMKKSRLSVEVLVRTAVQLVKLHQNQIVAGACERTVVATLLERVKQSMGELRGRFGFNVAGLGFWERGLAEENDAAFRDAGNRAFNLNARRKKRAAVASK